MADLEPGEPGAPTVHCLRIGGLRRRVYPPGGGRRGGRACV